MKKIIAALIVLCVCFSAFSEEITKEQAIEILRKSDRVFFPDISTYFMTVTTTHFDGAQQVWSIEAYKKGLDLQTCIWWTPKLMFNDVAMRVGERMYYKIAKWHKPDVFSYQSVFVDSNFSWGDIMSNDLAADYSIESFELVEVEGYGFVYKLELKAAKEGLYARMDILIEKDTNITLERIYYTASGEVYKTAKYKDVTRKNGMITGFAVEMFHEFFRTTSIAVIENIEVQENLPEYLFNPDGMEQIRVGE